MVRFLLGLTIAGGVLALAAATLLGLLAGLFPILDLFNHFRPFWLAGAVVLVLLALLFKNRRLIIASGLLALFNAALFGNVLWSGAPSAQAGTPAFMRVVAFNMLWSNKSLEDVVTLLKGTNADVLALSELRDTKLDAIKPLHAAYPHHVGLNDVVLFSKHPILAQGTLRQQHGRRGNHTILRWIRVDVKGTPVEVAGLHLSFPLLPTDQMADMQAVTAYAQNASRPLIVAGDFNLTPWSIKLQEFASKADLAPVNTLLFTWPAERLPPFVAIDNMYVSPQFSLINVETGPAPGADHLPLIADLAFQKKEP